MKKNFFDELDQDWGDVLANTYKEHNKFITVFRSNDSYMIDGGLTISINPKDYEAEETFDITYRYREIYVDSSDQYKFIIFYNNNTSFLSKSLEVRIVVLDKSYNGGYISDRTPIYNKYTIYTNATSDNGKYTKLQQDEGVVEAIPEGTECSVSKKFLKGFVKRALEATNYEKSRETVGNSERIYLKLGHSYDILEKLIDEKVTDI